MKLCLQTAWIGAILFLLSLPSFGQRADLPDPQRMWAVVIGISNYTHAEPLLFAASDAQALAEFVKSPRGGGIPEDRVISLIEDQASRYNILVELEALQSQIEPGDSVYIYIAGHGHLTERGLGYFIPSDGNLRVPAATAVSFSVIKELVEIGLAHAHRRVLVTDLCNAGRIGPETSELAAQIRNVLNRELMEIENPGGAFLNLLASQPTEPSWERDDLGHGVFTHVLLEALNGKAAPEGEIVHAADVVRYVLAEVPKYTANQQNPMVNDDYDPELPLAHLALPGPESLPRALETLLFLANLDPRLVRVEWLDPQTHARTVQQIPDATTGLRLTGLQPGTLELQFFDRDNQSFVQEVSLREGENRLDFSGSRLGRIRQLPDEPYRVASLGPMPFTAPALSLSAAAQQLGPSAAEVGVSSLLLRLDAGTQVYVDGRFYGTGEGEHTLLSLRGLEARSHLLRLVPSPDREHRFRINLFPGPQMFDWKTGELQPIIRVQPPPELLGPPAGLPSDQEELYLSFRRALWQDRLVSQDGDSAWDFYRQLSEALGTDIRRQIERDLIVAMGNKAQRTILKYLRGGDVRWNAETFEEGAEMLQLIQELFVATPAFESQRHFFAGRAQIERGEYEQAILHLQTSVSLDSEASHALNAFGLALWKQNRLQEAIEPLEQALLLTPNWTYPRNTLALIHLELRDYERSDSHFRNSIELDPSDSTAYHGLGQLHFLLGRWEEAEALLRRAIAIHPGNAYAHQTLGGLFVRQQRLEEAEQMLRLAIRLEPDEPAFHVSLAELLVQTERATEARGLYEGLMERHPDEPSIHQAYAQLLDRLDETEAARSHFQRSIELNPQDANLEVRFGLFLLGKGETDQAIDRFRRAQRIAPENPYAHYNLAAVFAARGALEEAEDHLGSSIESDARYPAPHLLLGRIRMAQNRHREALASLETALSHSIEAHQRQEIRDAIENVRDAIVTEAIAKARDFLDSGGIADAWSVLIEALDVQSGHLELRNSILEVLHRHPDRVDPSDLLPFTLGDAATSGFWRRQLEAERLWSQQRFEDALASFAQALEELSLAERNLMGATAFNLGNPDYGIHGTVVRWANRLLERDRFREALELMDSAVRHWLFAPVPDYTPLTIDSLAVPEDADEPDRFADFEVLHHPDRRAHAIYCRGHAALGEPDQVRRYLEGLETHRKDLALRVEAARLLERHGSSPEAMALLEEAFDVSPEAYDDREVAALFLTAAELHMNRGNRAEAQDAIRRGLERLPSHEGLRARLNEIRR